MHCFLLTLAAFWVLLTLVFLLIHIVHGDPVEQMLGQGAATGQIAETGHTGLDQPLPVPYGNYLAQILRGNQNDW